MEIEKAPILQVKVLERIHKKFGINRFVGEFEHREVQRDADHQHYTEQFVNKYRVVLCLAETGNYETGELDDNGNDKGVIAAEKELTKCRQFYQSLLQQAEGK